MMPLALRPPSRLSMRSTFVVMSAVAVCLCDTLAADAQTAREDFYVTDAAVRSALPSGNIAGDLPFPFGSQPRSARVR